MPHHDSLIACADSLAERIHRNDVRTLSGVPYIVHPRSVKQILERLEPPVPPALLAAGLLHDAVEDHPSTFSLQMLVTELTPASDETTAALVARYVEAATYDVRLETREAQRDRYLEQITTVEQALLSGADKVDNTNDFIVHLRSGANPFVRMDKNPAEEIKNYRRVIERMQQFSSDRRVALLISMLTENVNTIEQEVKKYA